MIKQRTLVKVIKAIGVGVHSGQKVTIALRPAPVNTGIVFRRVDLDPVVEIPAKVNSVGDTSLSTCLQLANVRVSTVEHLMSALSGLGVDNLYVDLNAEEVPIMDGSSAPFVFLIQSAGIIEQPADKQFIKIKKKISVKDGDKVICLKPFNGFKVDFGISFDHPLFDESNQNISIDFSSTSYVKEVSRARTFGFLKEYEYIRQNNMAKGASLDNAVVLDDFKVINEGGLRYNDEPLKHKVLDVIGDLYLLGHNIIGSLSAYKTGHALNNLLLQELLRAEDSWELVSFKDKRSLPISFIPAGAAVA